MKKQIFLTMMASVLMLSSSVNLMATTPENNPTEDKQERVFDVVEVMPQYPGGIPQMMKFIISNIKYPKDAIKKGMQGAVVVQFVVEPDGSVSNVHVVRSVFPSLDTEAVRMVKAMPKWSPGMQNGKPVRVRFNVPIRFSLNGNAKDVKK
ncbi:MAG: energy transducer TonB [Prevotella sp.]|jgi:protein TonB|nr:energy transducer TonB [Prevotella sp.]